MQDVVVAHDKKEPCKLEKALDLNDALSDLPPVCSVIFEQSLYYMFIGAIWVLY